MNLSSKLDMCRKEVLSQNINIEHEVVKYKDRYGFIFVYFICNSNSQHFVSPLVLLPDNDDSDDKENYTKFINLMKDTGMSGLFIDPDGKLDLDSIGAFLQVVEDYRLTQTGKKYPHLNTAERNLEKYIKGAISKYIRNVVADGRVSCLLDSNDNTLLVMKVS